MWVRVRLAGAYLAGTCLAGACAVLLSACAVVDPVESRYDTISRSLAKARKLSANRMLVELIENGVEAEKRKQQEFFDLAERFRSATNPAEVKRLGDQMGRMVFGG